MYDKIRNIEHLRCLLKFFYLLSFSVSSRAEMSSSQELTYHSIYLRKEQKRETRGSSPALKLKKKNDIGKKNIVHALFAHTHTPPSHFFIS